MEIAFVRHKLGILNGNPMISRTRNYIRWTILSTVLACVSATATPIELEIDFRDGGVWGGHGDSTYSSGGISVDANGNLLYRDDTDGYGILGGEMDEIDREEVLSVWFDDGFFDEPANWLTGVLITDLFPTPDGGTRGEAGWVTLLDALGSVIAEFFVNATEFVENGEFFLDFGGAFAPDSILFSAYVYQNGQYTGSEFSVAGFTTVPEPGTLLLLGAGLLVLSARRWRSYVLRVVR